MEKLKQEPIWVCWRYEAVKGRRTKVLYSIKGRRTGTSKKYSVDWVSYNEATQAKEKGSFDGIGFVIPAGIVVIDLDHISDDDILATELSHQLKTYGERSPSGHGIHYIATVDLTKVPQSDGKLSPEYYVKNPHNNMEIYFGGLTNRYMTFTGNTINEMPVAEQTDAIKAVLDKYMKKDLAKNPEIDHSAAFDDFDVIAALRKAKNGAKFIAIFDHGDITGYASPSEADLALCSFLAYGTGGDVSSIDTLFRQSKLYREEKWEREDYRKATIEKAIAGCSGRFHIASRPMPPYIYYDQNAKRLRVNCPMLARHIREDLRYIFVRDSAKGGVLRYVYESGCYRLYADEMLKGVIKEYIASFDENLLRMGDVGEVFQHIATDLVFKTNDELNADEDIINFQNCILRVSDMAILPHSADILTTIQIPCDWTGSPSATPVFDHFMAALTSGDKEIENLLLEFMGVCLSNVKGWRMKKALFMVGPGDTGKSQLKSLTERLLGRGNFIGIDLKEIEARFGTGNIYNKRLAGSSDMSFLTVDELKTFKKCTGGDSLFAEFKGHNGFEFTYNGLLWFCMNRLPKFGGDDGHWVYNRIMQVECSNVIPLSKQDKQLLDKLYAERSGIVYKGIMALKQVIANGYVFSEPESVAAARKTYMEENNTVIAFFQECMTERPQLKIKDNCTTGRVFEVYKAWCADNNHGYAKTAKEFRTELAAYLNIAYADLITRRGTGGNFYRRYTLTDEAKELYRKAYGYDDAALFASS